MYVARCIVLGPWHKHAIGEWNSSVQKLLCTWPSYTTKEQEIPEMCIISRVYISKWLFTEAL